MSDAIPKLPLSLFIRGDPKEIRRRLLNLNARAKIAASRRSRSGSPRPRRRVAGPSTPERVLRAKLKRMVNTRRVEAAAAAAATRPASPRSRGARTVTFKNNSGRTITKRVRNIENSNVDYLDADAMQEYYKYIVDELDRELGTRRR